MSFGFSSSDIASVAIILWSVRLVSTSPLPKWPGYEYENDIKTPDLHDGGPGQKTPPLWNFTFTSFVSALMYCQVIMCCVTLFLLLVQILLK